MTDKTEPKGPTEDAKRLEERLAEVERMMKEPGRIEPETFIPDLMGYFHRHQGRIPKWALEAMLAEIKYYYSQADKLAIVEDSFRIAEEALEQIMTVGTLGHGNTHECDLAYEALRKIKGDGK